MTGKWLAANLTDDIPVVIAAMFDEAERRDPAHERTWVALVDGNRQQIDTIREQAATRGVTVTIVIDFVHVLEYLWKAAWTFYYPGDHDAETWVADRARTILTGRAVDAAATIRHQADEAGYRGSERTGADEIRTVLARLPDSPGADHLRRRGFRSAADALLERHCSFVELCAAARPCELCRRIFVAVRAEAPEMSVVLGRMTGMTESPLAAAQRLFAQAVDALRGVADAGSAGERVSVLRLCEATARQLDQVTVATVAGLDREGVFADKGYKSAAQALSDLLGWERGEARRRTVAAEQVVPRTGLDGSRLPARLPATAEVFAAGRTGLRHVDIIARVLGGKPAGRLSPEQWAGVEAQLASKAHSYTPHELYEWGKALVELLDQDGEAPDDRPPALVNELLLTRLPDGGGKIKGRFEDAAMFDAIAAVIDAHAKPFTGHDDRSTAERQAEALADVCGYVLDHGGVPEARRPPPARERADPALRPGEPGACGVSGLRWAGRGGVAADVVLRRGRGAGGDEREGPAAGRRADDPHDPGRPGRAAAGGGGTRSRMCPSRVWSPGFLVRSASRDAVGVRRLDEGVELGHALPGSPQADPFHRVDRADPRRITGVFTAETAWDTNEQRPRRDQPCPTWLQRTERSREPVRGDRGGHCRARRSG